MDQELHARVILIITLPEKKITTCHLLFIHRQDKLRIINYYQIVCLALIKPNKLVISLYALKIIDYPLYYLILHILARLLQQID